jgi:hypothetical protein
VLIWQQKERKARTMSDRKVLESMDDIKNSVLVFLLDENKFTGKIQIEINCNQGGITNHEVFVKRKIIIKSVDKVS